jgi:hypothetical protein
MCLNLDLWFILFYCLFVKFFPVPFHIFDLAFYYLFFFFDLIFYRHLVSRPFFFVLVVSVFLAHVILSLTYPNLLGNKRLSGCCCCCFMRGPRPIFVAYNFSQFGRNYYHV